MRNLWPNDGSTSSSRAGSHPQDPTHPHGSARPGPPLEFRRFQFNLAHVTPDDFKPEMEAAIRAYDRCVVCLERPTPDFERSLRSLMARAIQAYENRGPGMRHGVALDKYVTVILSVSDTDRPLCGIYFNLYSPYYGKPLPKTVQEVRPSSPDKFEEE